MFSFQFPGYYFLSPGMQKYILHCVSISFYFLPFVVEVCCVVVEVCCD